jgi:3-phenylpropionate/trans-cinnamate dioxygenase ferredoxin reductase component
VLCDATLRTSAPDVFAAGDMCEHDSPLLGRVVRIEHEEVAAAQGRTAARGMLGRAVVHDEVPYFWTDLADWATAEWSGLTAEGEHEIVRGSIAEGAFSVLRVAGGRVVSALSVERGEDLAAAQRLIAERVNLGGRLGELAEGDLEAL